MITLLMLSVIRTLIVILGLIIGTKAFLLQRHYPESRGIFILLGLGFITITIGVTLEGILFQIYHVDILVVHAIESFITALGLFLILCAIYLNK